jgi:hypothetical protein
MFQISSSQQWEALTQPELYPGKKTISKMYFYEQWKYIEEQMKLGNVIQYKTHTKSLYGSEIVLYYDKNTEAYSICHPWTGSAWGDITEEEFRKYEDSIYERSDRNL